MCDPTLIGLGTLAIGIAGAVGQHNAQEKAASTNKAEALRAAREASHDISLQQAEQKLAATKTIYQADRDARSAQALARVSASEAGVTGVSVEALMGDLDRKRAEYGTSVIENLDISLKELEREKVSGRTIAQGRIAQVQQPSPFALGLQIGAMGLSFWSGQIARQPSSSN